MYVLIKFQTNHPLKRSTEWLINPQPILADPPVALSASPILDIQVDFALYNSCPPRSPLSSRSQCSADKFGIGLGAEGLGSLNGGTEGAVDN